MAHPRKLIRQAVVALLANATDAGDRVKGTRVEPHKKSQLPAVGVYTLTDVVVDGATTALEERHDVELEVVAWVAHTDAVPADDAMDDIAEQLEARMRTDPFLGGKASKVTFHGTVMQVVEDDGRTNPLVGIVTLTYGVDYSADLTSQEPIDDFLRVKATHRIVGAVDENAASDEFVVQETPP